MISKKLGKLIIYFFSVTTLILLFFNIFLTKDLPISSFHYFLLPNGITLLLGIFALGLFFWIIHKIDLKRIKINNSILEVAIFTLFFFFQLLFTYCTYSYVAWDPEVLWSFGLQINSGYEIDPSYFSTYPNNLLLLNIVVLIQRIASVLPKELFFDYIYLFLIINCILNSITGILIYKLIKSFCGKRTAWVGWAMYAALIGTSGWLDIYYSDSLTLIIPISVGYIWSIGKKNIRFLFIGFLALFGTYIKPQCIIILIAIVMWEIISLFFSDWEKKKDTVKHVAFVVVGLLVGMLVAGLCKRTSFKIDEEASFSPTHYLMMGLEGYGSYNLPDVEFSQSFATKRERNSANLAEAANRVKAKGFDGMMKHIVGKALYNYHDGTFGFENITCSWFWRSDRTVENPVAALLTNAVRGGGKIHLLTDCLRQAVWLAVMLFSGVFPFAFKRVKDKEIECVSVFGLSLFGLFMFLMLFEARARYLYIYIPLYICISAITINAIFKPEKD